MDDLGSVLIPAIAAVGGAGLTAIAGVLSSRERYSQRIERLGKVRESVADDVLLRSRLDRMIHHEISLASTSKSTAFAFSTSIALIVLGYFYAVLSILYRQKSSEPPIIEADYKTLFWISNAILAAGVALLLTAITRRNKIIRTTLPRAISGDEIATFTQWYTQRLADEAAECSDQVEPR